MSHELNEFSQTVGDDSLAADELAQTLRGLRPRATGVVRDEILYAAGWAAAEAAMTVRVRRWRTVSAISTAALVLMGSLLAFRGPATTSELSQPPRQPFASAPPPAARQPDPPLRENAQPGVGKSAVGKTGVRPGTALDRTGESLAGQSLPVANPPIQFQSTQRGVPSRTRTPLAISPPPASPRLTALTQHNPQWIARLVSDDFHRSQDDVFLTATEMTVANSPQESPAAAGNSKFLASPPLRAGMVYRTDPATGVASPFNGDEDFPPALREVFEPERNVQ